MWEMTRKNGTYLYERVADPMTGKSRILSVKIQKLTASGRKEARRRLQDKIEAARPQRMHLSELMDIYNAEHERLVRKSTFDRDASSLRTMLSILDDVYVDAMTAGYVRRKLVESGKGNGTLNELIKRFKSFLGWAYRNDYCDREVKDKLQLFPDQSAREKIANKFLERKELKALTDAMELERWKLLTLFLAMSGLRIGEAIGLDDKDVGEEYISVTETYNERYHSSGPAKTASSIREVYIQPELADIIKKIRVCMKRQRIMLGYKDEGYFMAGIDGGRVGYTVYKNYLKEIAAKVVPDKNVVPHTLRHTMTSLFAEAGVPLETISRRLGHENSGITKRIYLHVTENKKIQENRQVAAVTLLA